MLYILVQLLRLAVQYPRLFLIFLKVPELWLELRHLILLFTSIV